MGVEELGAAEQCMLPVELSLLCTWLISDQRGNLVWNMPQPWQSRQVRMPADTNVNIAWPFLCEHQLCSSRRRKYQQSDGQFNWIKLQMYGLCIMFLHSLSLIYKPEREHLLWCFTPVENSLLWAVAKIWAPGLSRCHSRPFQLSGYQHSGNCSSLIVKTDVHCWL